MCYTPQMAEQDDFTEDEIRREDSPFQTRERMRKLLPGVQSLFDHSDDNIRTGKSLELSQYGEANARRGVA